MISFKFSVFLLLKERQTPLSNSKIVKVTKKRDRLLISKVGFRFRSKLFINPFFSNLVNSIKKTDDHKVFFLYSESFKLMFSLSNRTLKCFQDMSVSFSVFKLSVGCFLLLLELLRLCLRLRLYFIVPIHAISVLGLLFSDLSTQSLRGSSVIGNILLNMRRAVVFF